MDTSPPSCAAPASDCIAAYPSPARDRRDTDAISGLSFSGGEILRVTGQIGASGRWQLRQSAFGTSIQVGLGLALLLCTMLSGVSSEAGSSHSRLPHAGERVWENGPVAGPASTAHDASLTWPRFRHECRPALRPVADPAGALQLAALVSRPPCAEPKAAEPLWPFSGTSRPGTLPVGGFAVLNTLSAALLTIAGMLALIWVLVHRDLQRRREAEAERDQLFEHSLDLMCVAKADGFFKRVNPAFTHTLGWSEQELLARPFLDFVHPEDQAATRAEVERQIVHGEKALRFVNRHRHQDGSWRTLAWNSVPQPGGLMFATARDITELEQARLALVHSERKLAVTLDSIGDAVLATDAQGRVTRLNPIAEKLTGWPLAEALGRPVAEVFRTVHQATRQPEILPWRRCWPRAKLSAR